MQPSNHHREAPDAPCSLALHPRLSENTTFLMARIGFDCRIRFDAKLMTCGLRPRHYSILTAVEDLGPVAQVDIAGALGLDPSQVVALLDDLEERGFIQRPPDLSDRRRRAVTATAAGRRMRRQCQALANEVQDEVLAPLSEEERRVFHELLVRLAAPLQTEHVKTQGRRVRVE